jgi:hypothetical protein
MKSLLATLAFLVAAGACAAPLHQEDSQRQSEVAQRGARVMPFSLAATSHVFTKTRDGGIQRVIARNEADAKQTRLIREHLHRIRQEFASGDFSDPAQIHGDDMPGLAKLKAARPGRLTVSYQEVKGGAQLVYRSSDPELVAALHEWFDAQLFDHGADAAEGHHHHHGM